MNSAPFPAERQAWVATAFIFTGRRRRILSAQICEAAMARSIAWSSS